MPDKKKSFWVTLPGILTGIAAVITAVTGLYVAFSPDQKKKVTSEPQTTTGLSENWTGSWICKTIDHEMHLTINGNGWSSSLKGYYPVAYGNSPATEEYIIKSVADSNASGEYIYYDTSPNAGYQGKSGAWKGDWSITLAGSGLLLTRKDHTTFWQGEYQCKRR
ncbi:MAG: hypothetical protein FIA98_14780 [Anaerolineae bacterium]|nr:hypothetical protein [Anaerolineae bacterium]